MLAKFDQTPKKLLALETSTPRAAVVLVDQTGTFQTAAIAPDQRHGRELIPAIRNLLRDSDLVPAELEGIVVGLGPGSFTGLRVGLMAAKTFAYAAQLPLLGLDSLELIARNAPAEYSRVIAVVDAQRGELHVAEFHRDQGRWIRLGQSRIVPAAAVFENLDAETFVIGPGLERLDPALSGSFLRDHPSIHAPDPQRLAEMARAVWTSGRPDDLWTLEPVYLRRSAAEDKKDAEISHP